MYPNLLGQKAFYNLTDENMGKIIGDTRDVYRRKMKNGKFGPEDCKAFCKRFNKSFEYLFATNDEQQAS